MIVDWTISISNVLTVVGMLFGAAGIVWAIKGDVRILNIEIASMKTQLQKLTEVLIAIGTHKQQLDDHSRRLARLEDQRD